VEDNRKVIILYCSTVAIVTTKLRGDQGLHVTDRFSIQAWCLYTT